MNVLLNLINEDISKYLYLMTEKEIKRYSTNKVMCMLIGILFGISILFFMNFDSVAVVLLVGCGILGFKIPYLLLKLQHNQRCNEVVIAIPIWINLLYSLINENNIHNAIKSSYEHTPKCMQPELKEFIHKLDSGNCDRNDYLSFLDRYNVDGFKDIMSKIYEFRNLDKEKLKYEITSLNDELNDIETMKRKTRFKSSLSYIDYITGCMTAIPCLYLFYCSNVVSDILM